MPSSQSERAQTCPGCGKPAPSRQVTLEFKGRAWHITCYESNGRLRQRLIAVQEAAEALLRAHDRRSGDGLAGIGTVPDALAALRSVVGGDHGR